MVAKIPIRTVYTGAAATGLAEFQSGEFIDYVVGGTGLVALGTANQVLATNSAADAIEWQAPTTGDITGVTAGTGLSGGGTSGTVTLNVEASQTQITAVGTIGTGTWQGTSVANAYVADDLTISGGTVNNSVIGGSTAAVGTFTQVDIEATGDLRLQDTTGGQYVALQAPGTVTTYTVTMPGAVGSSGQALRASDGSGTLEWFTLEVGDITNVIAGTGMTGGGTSGEVTLDVIGGTGITANANDIAIDSTVTTLTGSQTLTNKTLTSPILNTATAGTSFTLLEDATVIFEGATDDAYETTLTVIDPTADRIVSLPNDTDTLVGKATTDTLTNKTISGSSNTLSNIANGSLTNSTVSYGGVQLSLGGTDATPAFNLADATAYIGDSSLVTTGTVTSGTWQGTAVADGYVANDLTIASGTVNNTVVGGSQPAAGTFTQVDVTGTGDLRLQDTTGGQYVALQAPGTVSSSWTATFPAAVGSSGQALRTSDGSGTLEWFTPEVGDITGVTAGDGLTGGGTSGTVTLDVVGGTGITANANDIAIDSTVATLTGTQTLTNKTLTSPVLNGSLSGTAFLDEDSMSSDSAVAAASQQSIKAYVDAVSSGLDLKESSHAATTANLSSAYDNGSSGVGATLTNNSTQAALTVDGQLMVAAERLLVKDQTAGLQNGIYTVTTVGDGSTNWVLTRATDFDGSPSNEVDSGAFTFVETGTVNADSGWVVTTDGTITIGTTAISFSQFSGAGQITAGAGMTKSGNTLNVIGTSNKITVSADAVTISTSYVGQNTITTLGTIATGVWNGTAIANANLANSTVAFGGVSLSLGGADTTPAFNLSDATAYTGDSSLVTTGTVTSGTWQGTAVADGYLGTGINAIKLADGTVTNAELQYINTLSSNAQTHITSVKTTADAAATKGFSIAMGVALG